MSKLMGGLFYLTIRIAEISSLWRSCDFDPGDRSHCVELHGERSVETPGGDQVDSGGRSRAGSLVISSVEGRGGG